MPPFETFKDAESFLRRSHMRLVTGRGTKGGSIAISAASVQELGLRVEELSAEALAIAVGLLRTNPILSAADCFALTLAEVNRWTLLTGDGPLRALALARKLECHGVLWLLDRMLDAKAVTAAALHLGLTAIAEHPRCRLPPREVRLRLERYGVARG
jgi:hypothetical protein